ncbi:right-handed parallel beta-helix repeat-containing protein [Mycobacterium sp. C3-094]
MEHFSVLLHKHRRSINIVLQVSRPGQGDSGVAMDINTHEGGDSTQDDRPSDVNKSRRGFHRRRIEPYAWLAAGAVGIGIATALTAPAVAQADDGSSASATTAGPTTSAHSSSARSDRTPRAFEQRVRGDANRRITRAAAGSEADPVRGNERKALTRRDGTSKRGHRDNAAATTDGDGARLQRSAFRDRLRTETEQEAPERVDKQLTAPTNDQTPTPTTPAPNRVSELLEGLFTRVNDRTTTTTTAGRPAAATLKTVAASSQPKTLKSVLAGLFPRLSRAVPTAGAVTATPTIPSVPTKDDAGLSVPFQRPDAPSGRTLNVRDYGATSNQSSDNDALAIQKAINAAKAGDTVYIPNGTYHIRSTINLKSGVSLIGESRGSTILAGAYSSQPHAMIYAAPGTTNLTVSSFTITSASGPTYKAAIRLGLEGTGQVSRIAVQNLFIEKFERFGVQLQNAYQVVVENNVIKNATAVGGGGQGYGVIVDQALSNNNWIVGNEIGPVIRHAVLVQKSANHNLIEQNTITGTVSGAIDLHGEDEYANEIRYNTISNGVRDGTSVSPNGGGIEVGEFSGVAGTTLFHDNSGPGNYIHHNVVTNYSYGLRVVNNSNYTFIEDNIFYNNIGAGIQADLAPLNNLYISGNQLYNNGAGVILYDVTQAVVDNNSIRDNRDYGLWANAGTSTYLITGNTITGSRVNVTLKNATGVYLPLITV